MRTFRIQSFLFLALAVAAPTGALRAQLGGGDPQREIQEIAEAIDKQLKEIDRLLLESGKAGQSREKPREMLEQAVEGTRIVEDGLEKLIEKLHDMKNQSGNGQGGGQQNQNGGQQSDSDQRQSGGGQMGRSDGNRRENQTPDFVDQGGQPGEQQGGQQQGEQQGQQQNEQQGQQQGESRARGGQENPSGGENRVGNNAPESPTGPGNRGDGEGSWGELQPYLNFLRNRGASPKVPPKFRKYYEAYRKGKAEKRQ